MSTPSEGLIFASSLDAYSANPASSYFYLKGKFGQEVAERLGIGTTLGIEDQALEAIRRQNAIQTISRVLSFFARNGEYQLTPLWNWATRPCDDLYHADLRQDPIDVMIASADRTSKGWQGVKRVMHAAYTEGIISPGYEDMRGFPRELTL